MNRKIYFVAGEVSGDNHGAALMRSLRESDPSLEFTGRGGPKMMAMAGPEFQNWLDQAAVLGLWEVIKKYGYFRKQFSAAVREIAEQKPDAVVLIDYPGFNLRLASALRRKGLTKRLIYYISPQVWAWNRGRIKKMARYLDVMLCIFPFEADLYNLSGLRTKFVGHPMIDRLRAEKIELAREPNLVGLFPGSRRREVEKIFPILVRTVIRLRPTRPTLKFEISAASAELAQLIEVLWRVRCPKQPMPVVRVGDAAGLMQRTGVGIVASGSATLEAAYFRMPFVLVYKVAWPTYAIARAVVRVKYLGMPNVLADRVVVPEFIQHRAKPDALVRSVTWLLDDSAARNDMTTAFDRVIASLGEGGASAQAARAILEEL